MATNMTRLRTSSPNINQVELSWEKGEGSLVWSVEVADLLTPVAAYMRLAQLAEDEKNTLLFESVEGGVARGRYSVIALLPDLVWRCHGGQAAVCNVSDSSADTFTQLSESPLDSLRKLRLDSQMALPDDMPPMIGGIFGYLGYDMVRQMEHLPNVPPDDLGLPEGMMVRPSLFAVFDTVSDELTLAATIRPKSDCTAVEAYQKAQDLLARAREMLSAPLPLITSGQPPVTTTSAVEPRSTFTKDGFCTAVRRIQEYIFAGDAFQVVPSQRFSIDFELPSLMLYRALRRINPAPFLFHLNFGDFALVGSSPEILVRLNAGAITVRPLAGTRPRGETAEEDLRLERELLADEKELAEHLMLIDLGRNDVGRVSETGTVKVTEKFAIERFSHVMHISSTVEGRLQPGLDAVDALVAAFPAGTLTGAPKIRAMEIIDELEPTRRATYAGCIGYFGAAGDMDTCIGLRMAVLKGGQMYVQAGCGVVADSIPEMEYEETRQKARALFRAAEEAVRYAGTGKQ